MNTPLLRSLLQHPAIEVTGWTLLHFVWQGILIALAANFALSILRRATPQSRYLLACSTMTALILAPVVTAGWLFTESGLSPTYCSATVNDWQQPASPLSWSSIEPRTKADSVWFANENRPAIGNADESTTTIIALADDSVSWMSTRWLDACLPWIVGTWCCGVVLLSIRLLAGLYRVWQWKRQGSRLTDTDLIRRTAELATRMGIRTRFQLLQSAQAAVPAVIGWLRPAVIVPISLITTMSPQELDSLLAHELAHIRRHDYLVNLLQTVVETLLFYHPAVWWISSVLRAERENCCDDVAAEMCGDRIVLAKALARMEELRCHTPGLAMSARNGSLLYRIRRILLVPESHSVGWWPAGVISLTSLFIGVGSLWLMVVNGNDNLPWADAKQSVSSMVSVELNEDLPSESPSTNADDYPIHKPEIERIDAKTGQSHPVLAAVQLSMLGKSPVSVDLKYSNLFNYSLIPARVACELNAIELGVLDFGKRPDPEPAGGFNGIDLKGFVPPPPNSISEANKKPKQVEQVSHEITVDQLTEPAGARRIVAYDDDAMWIPDHLAFYGMNANEQTRFRVVRIDRVDLGIGPAFGPVNALVIDDANTDLGVLGSNWAKIPRGKNGEGFVWAAVGGAYFMAFPDAKTQNVSESNEDKILATHTYNLTRRESTGWIEVNGVGVPVDAGVEALGIRVHVTLMQTVVAIDSISGKVLWNLDAGKQSPTWHKISILELPEPSGDGKLFAVELAALNGNLRRRLLLRTGEEMVAPTNVSEEEVPEIQVLKRDGDRILLATIESPLIGRTKVELIRRFQEILMRSGGAGQGSWVTDQETLVSAEQPRMLMAGPTELKVALDAQEAIFNLPEGSGIRAEFAGEKIEITSGAKVTKIVVTDGRVKLFDSNGVERADASPDGGAEQLVVEIRMAAGEGQLKLRTQRLKPDADYPQPPVQVKCNLATGALGDEQQPPHGAVRFAVENPEETEPVRLKMRWHYDLHRLVEEVERETGRKWLDLLLDQVPHQTFEPRQTESPSPFVQTANERAADSDMLGRARALGDWLAFNSEVRFDSRGFMRLAAELMALDETRRAERLRTMASAGLERQTIVFCRMLFEARPGSEFRRPGLGGPSFVGTESEMRHWPLEPITLVNDVPLVIVEGYTLAGRRETAQQYLEYCLLSCDWTKRSFEDNDGKVTEAERIIRQPTFWHGGLDSDEWRELGGLLKQLRPSFMIGIKQQPHYAPVVPVYLLDLESRVDSNNVVEELNKRGWLKDTPITFVLDDDAQPEWIAQILKPTLAAGCREFEFIRWQQSVEPVSIPELNHLLNHNEGNAVGNNRDDRWPALAAGSGLQCRLALTSEKPSVGLPLLLKLELRNSGAQPTEVNWQNYAPFRVLRVERKQADGSIKLAPFIGMTPQTEGSDQTLAPGQVITVWENVDASTLYLLEAGAYQIFAEGGVGAAANNLSTDSNRLEVNLQPGQLAPQQVFLGELLKILPEGWTLSTGFGAFFLSHSPTDLKTDITTIQLWFTVEKLPENYELGQGVERQIVGLVGQTDLGYLNIGAHQRAAELWPEYARDVQIAADKAFVANSIDKTTQPKIDDQSNSAESEARNPWRVFGLVTDAEAKPIAGATVRAHTGIGSLKLAGEAKTNAAGKYDLQFGQGFVSENKQLVQAATISIEFAGHFEKNLHRQGDRIATMEQPTGELGWGAKTLEDLFLPDKPREINFVMLPAVKVSGLVIGENGDHLDGVRVSLVGDEMPPSSSVVANTRTDKGGRFELTGIPTGYQFQILVEPYEAQPPELGWASAPIVFAQHDDGNAHLEYSSIAGQSIDFSFQHLNLILKGTGTNWKTALKEAREKKLELTWDGLATDTVVRAGMTFLELGSQPK